MRKQYLLALMASVVCGMSVEAQVMDDYPAVSLQDVRKEALTADGAIVITTTEAQAVQVYGVTGVCHYNATVSGTATIANLPAGIYIVTAGGETLKVAVR